MQPMAGTETQQWEYCYVLLIGHPKDHYRLCTEHGESQIRVDTASLSTDQRSAVIAHLGKEGWEAFAAGALEAIWFKRRISPTTTQPIFRDR
jgi:hypothetical protein